MENHSLSKSPLSLPSFSIPKISLFIGLTITGQWFLSDVAHIPGGGLGLLLGLGCIVYFLKPGKVSFEAPSTVQGWVRRCHDVLENFEYLLEDGEQSERKKERINSLQKIIDRSEDQSIGFLKTKGVKLPDKENKKSNKSFFPTSSSCKRSKLDFARFNPRTRFYCLFFGTSNERS